MTDDELDAIVTRAEAATAGPWRLGTFNVWQQDSTRWICDTDELRLHGQRHTSADFGHHEDDANADFIAHARTDVPALIAEVRRLRALVEEAAG